MARKRIKEDDLEKDTEPEEEFVDFKTTDAYSFEAESEMQDDILGDDDLNDYPKEFDAELEQAAREAAEEEKKKKEAKMLAQKAAEEQSKPKKKTTKKKAPVKKKTKTVKKIDDKKPVKKKTVKKKSVKKKQEPKKPKSPEKEMIAKEPEIKKEETHVEPQEPKMIDQHKQSFDEGFKVFSGRNVVIALCFLLIAVWVYAAVFIPSDADIPQKDSTAITPAPKKNSSLENNNAIEEPDSDFVPVQPKPAESNSNKHIRIIKERE